MSYPNIHPNCKCEIVDGTWILHEKACEICQEAKSEFDSTGSFSLKHFHLAKQEELELVEFTLDENFGDVPVISIVDEPAIEKTFQLFNELKQENFQIVEDKQEILGPAMVPNKSILRYDAEAKKYYNCFFTADTIKKCSEIFLKNSNHTQANFNHGKQMSNDLFVAESWIVEDPKNDKSNALGFEGVEAGTWFIKYKVTSPELWNTIKTSGFTGFSIEGYFDHKEFSKQESKIYNLLQSSLSDEDKIRLIQAIIK